MKQNKWKIKTKLIAGVCFLSIITCTGMGLLSYRAASETMQKSIEEALPNLAKEGANYIRSQLNNYFLGIEGVAHRHDMQSMDWQIQKPVMEDEIRRLGYLGMGIVTPDGQARYADGQTAALGDRQYVRDAFAGKTAISDIIISRVVNAPVLMLATPIRNKNSQIIAVLIARLSDKELARISNEIKYGKDGYSYIINKKGTMITHRNREFLMESRNFLEEGKSQPEYRSLSRIMQRMVKGETGFAEYLFMGTDRLVGYAPIEGTQWFISVGAYKDKVFADLHAIRFTFFLLSLGFIACSAIAAIFFARILITPIQQVVTMLKDISEGEGDLTRRLTVSSRDEIGDLARYFNQFVEKIQGIVANIGENVQTLIGSAASLSSISVETSQNVETLSARTSTVAGAAEKSQRNTIDVASSMEETTINLTSVAAATEEMSATIGEIASSASKARAISSEAGRQAASISVMMQDFSQAAREIDKVSETITNISSQTNLLALNATIEAARAGEAGRGFAVVANEVKELARQTAQATEDIKDRIGGVRQSSANAVADIQKITTVISDMSGHVVGIAAAIEEQTAVTREVAAHIAQASIGVQKANKRAGQIASTSEIIAKDIQGIDLTAGKLRSEGRRVEASAIELSSLAEQFKELVAQFKV